MSIKLVFFVEMNWKEEKILFARENTRGMDK